MEEEMKGGRKVGEESVANRSLFAQDPAKSGRGILGQSALTCPGELMTAVVVLWAKDRVLEQLHPVLGNMC